MSTKPHPSASLYVGDLSSDVTEGILFEIFNTVGPVASIRVCRDTFTRRSLGYAYVNFHNVVDAERALDTLNNAPIKGRPCRIMWSQRDPSIRKSGIGNIFIKNLDPAIGHKELYDTFSAFGNILSCKVALDEQTGESKGFGFVHFENAESAENSIKMVNEMMLGVKKVYVGKFIPKRERVRQQDSSWTNVYVKDVDPAVSEEQLRSKFEEFGPTTSCVVMKKEDGTSKGFGFVNFDKHEDASRAVDELNGSILGTKKLWCGRAQKKSEREQELKKKFKQLKMEEMTKYQGINLFIKNLEDDISEDRLKKEFLPYGAIRSCKIMTDDKMNSKGFGFVCFTTPEEAQKAITEMSGRILQGCSKPLYVALHEPKEVRRQKLAQRHVARTKGMRPGNVPATQPLYAPGYYPGNGTMAPQGFVYPPPGPGQIINPRGRGWAAPQTQYSTPVPPAAGGYPNVVPPIARGRGGATPGSSRGGGAGGGNNSGGRGTRPIRRNQSQPQQAQPASPPVDQAQGGLPAELTPEYLSQFTFEQQKLLLGERLYPMINKVQPKLAGKITGMFLDSGWAVGELLSLVNDGDKLNVKIDEAVNVLDRARQTIDNEEQVDAQAGNGEQPVQE